jgi:hypothetical protein
VKSLARGLVVFILVVGAGIGIFSWMNSHQHEINSPLVLQSPPSQPSAAPSDHYPVTETDLPTASALKRKPVPRIEESDQSVEEMLSELIGKERFESLFNLKNIVRRIVVTVDNATKHSQISQEYSPFAPLERDFRIKGKKEEEQVIDPSNFRRYQPYALLARTVDAEGLVAIYVHFYPLFQSAYKDLGTRGYFNDRLIQAIDILLGAPDVKGSIKVARVSVHRIYKYVDSDLEALPAAQKIMVRMGSENASVIKTKLRELRALLTHLNKNDVGKN